MPAFGLTDNDGVDVGNKYVTKEYLINNYSNLFPSVITPSVWLMGSNSYGVLGDNSITDRSSPVQLAGGGTWEMISIKNGNNTSINSAAGIKTDGTFWTWGRGLQGQLGDNTTISKSSPVTIVGGGTWQYCVAASGAVAGIKTDGSLWIWGSDGLVGRLGLGTTTDRSSPVTVAGGGNDWIKIDFSSAHAIALKQNGVIYTWGSNFSGQLGDNSAVSRSSPATVLGSSTLTPWINIAAGTQTSYAIKSDNSLWAWGIGQYGVLGDNTTVSKSSPVTVVGGTGWKTVAAGERAVASVKNDGTLWSWGQNTYGQLGDGTTINRSSPVTVVGGGTTWTDCVIAGMAAALKTDGTLWVWGNNLIGSQGNNSTTRRSSPTAFSMGGNYWKKISVGLWSAAHIREEGDW